MRDLTRLVLPATLVLTLIAPRVPAQAPDRVSVLVEFAAGGPRDAARAFAAAQGAAVRYEYSILPRVMNLRNVPTTALPALRALPGVVRVSDDPVLVGTLHDSTPLIHGLQSQIQTAGLSANAAGTRICVVDTGIDSNHWMFQDWPDTSKTRIDYAAARNFIVPGTFPEDDNGHGAHASGIAAGRQGLFFNNLPMQGVAPKATIVPVKILDSAGTGQGSDLIAAFQHCTDPNLANGPADVISVSLGYGQFSDRATCDAEDVVQAANAAVAAGAVVVAAAGNDSSTNALAAPACGTNVISVGATWDYTGLNFADFFYCLSSATVDTHFCVSDQSPMLDVVAPGCSLHSAAADLTTDAPDGVVAMCGTSMAAPHVSGLAALLLQQNPALTPAGVRDCIRNGAVDLGPPGADPAYGNGRIDVTNSLYLCRSGGATNQPPTASFTYSCSGFVCAFTSTSSDADGSVVDTAWNFGDGATDHGPSVSHTYASGGTYTVGLTATDDDGASRTASQTISVNKPPTASFTFSCATLSCTFDGSGSSDQDGTILSYVWSFGDGATAAGVTASHTYAAGGTYTATLTVTDDDGAVQYRSQSVTVSTTSSTAPSAPTNLNVQITTSGTGRKSNYAATLTWTDNANNEDSYLVRRFKLSGRKNQQTCALDLELTLPANSTGYTDSGASTSTCKYAVAARNSVGTSTFVEKAVTVP